VSGKATLQYGMRHAATPAAWRCTLALCCSLAATPAQAQAGHGVLIHRTGGLGAAGITESSGVAVSHRHRGVLWTHNDSGDGPFLYAVDSTGRRLATVRVRGAAMVDWEDVALGPCPDVGGHHPTTDCLYIGDIGDNGGRRAYVTLYVVREPELPGASGIGATDAARSLRVRYADGPHDAEALTVDRTGSACIITKGRGGPILRYAIPARAFRQESVTVRAVDTLAVMAPLAFERWVTGAAAAPSGSLAVVRTYTDLYLYAIDHGRWAPAGRCHLGLAEPQGEGVDFLDERTRSFVLTSERGAGAQGVITTVRCPPP
jgi:hypothetical protein